MLNGAEIQAGLSDLEAYFGGQEKHLDSDSARAAVDDLENEFRPAVDGISRRDKGSREVHRQPKAAAALNLLERIRQAIDITDPGKGTAVCAELRKLSVEQRWI